QTYPSDAWSKSQAKRLEGRPRASAAGAAGGPVAAMTQLYHDSVPEMTQLLTVRSFAHCQFADDRRCCRRTRRGAPDHVQPATCQRPADRPLLAALRRAAPARSRPVAGTLRAGARPYAGAPRIPATPVARSQW